MCGVTRLEDALAAVEAGVDALGFIFFDRSPRNIDPEEARLIIEALPPLVDTVGVFVNRRRNEVEEIIHFCGLAYAQLHGDESPKYCERLARFASPCQILKVLRVGPGMDTDSIHAYDEHVRGYLLDTLATDKVGGTGRVFDWSIIHTLGLNRPFLLAGGLNAENIGQALEAVRPYGVDVNSGVESAPGVKDHGLIREFVRLVHR